MLVIRMQRTGRRGHAQFRVVVQDSRRTPTSGKIVALLGYFNPHSKETNINKDKAAFYLEHGAQPSDRVARLLKREGVELPKWVRLSDQTKRDVRSPEKRRSTRPADAEAPAEKPTASEEVDEAKAESTEQPPTDEQPEEVVKAETAKTGAEPTSEASEANGDDQVPSTEEIATESTDQPAENADDADKKPQDKTAA